MYEKNENNSSKYGSQHETPNQIGGD